MAPDMPGRRKRSSILSIFGDGGRYAGRVDSCRTHEIHFSKYYFDDYIRLGPCGMPETLDAKKLSATMEEAFSGAYDAVACDSSDAILLRFLAKRHGLPRLPFIINEVDCFEMACWVSAFIKKQYGEDFFDEFVRMPENLWQYILPGRRAGYRGMGIAAKNLFYWPMCTASIEFLFPRAFKAAAGKKTSVFKDRIIAAGTHERDYETLADAVEGTGLEVHVITNTKLNPAFDAEGIVWHDSLPEEDFYAALRVARLVVAPLKESNRAAGQLACAIPMRFGRAVVAADVEAVRQHIKHRRTGYLYKAGSPASLRRVLLAADRDDEGRKRVGRSAALRERELSEKTKETVKRLLERIQGR